MKPPPFAYRRPDSLEEALAIVGEHADDAKILAGGQSLVALMNLRLASPAYLVDITRLDELAHIGVAGGHLTVGAAVRQAAVEDAAEARACPLVAEALPLIAHREIRNAGTLCGSLAHGDPAAELPTVALALDAECVLRSARGERTVRAKDMFLGYLTTATEPDEILVEARFPVAPARSGFAFEELSPRHGDYGIVGVAAAVTLDDGGAVQRLAVAFSGVDGVPVRADWIEGRAVGCRLDAATIADLAHDAARPLQPQADLQGSSEFRRHVAGVLAGRALQRAQSRAESAG